MEMDIDSLQGSRIRRYANLVNVLYSNLVWIIPKNAQLNSDPSCI